MSVAHCALRFLGHHEPQQFPRDHQTMATLSYPTSIRGAGVGWAQAATRVGTTIGFYFFPLVRETVGLGTTLLLLTIVPILGLITTLLIRWEPVGANVDAEQLLTPAAV